MYLKLNYKKKFFYFFFNKFKKISLTQSGKKFLKIQPNKEMKIFAIQPNKYCIKEKKKLKLFILKKIHL
tara:strand:- start:231 stop:437 length:207 start_codon:yes stop_codon:yes gene_type:complete